MFKKLEKDSFEKVQAVDSGTDAKCDCRCKTVQKNNETANPEATLASTAAGVHYDISG